VDPTGTSVYTSETSNNRIQKFDNTGLFILKWGTAGAGPGQFSAPYGVAVDGVGQVIVADTGNNRMQRFMASGAFDVQWGTAGAGDGQFQGPRGVAVGPIGEIYVADSDNHRIQKFAEGVTPTANSTWGRIKKVYR
jgi:DNA-binding beta-propeller fold protein YncE